jgi:hypothetical protein
MSLLSDIENAPEADLVAQHIVTAQGKNGKRHISAADLTAAITDIRLTDNIKGSSTLEIDMLDPNWSLSDDGYWDANDDGKLDEINLQYGRTSAGDPQWWTLTKVNPKASGYLITLTFMEQAAVDMMRHHGPLNISRGKRTRAEFLKLLCRTC